MIPTSFLVPLRSNSGQPFSRTHFRQLEAELVDAFGGFTMAGVVEGEWQAEGGAVYSDRSRRYEVALQSWRDVQSLVTIVDRTCVTFGQEAMFVTIAGIPEIMAAGP